MRLSELWIILPDDGLGYHLDGANDWEVFLTQAEAEACAAEGMSVDTLLNALECEDAVRDLASPYWDE